MRIAQISPLAEAVPPKLYGGTERVVSFLTEELVAMGHDVTLFASGDSVTSAELHSCWPRALRLDPAVRDHVAPHLLMLEKVARRAHEFDILHFHMDYWSFPLFSRLNVPFVTTLHGRLDLPEFHAVVDEFPHARLVSISDDQRSPMVFGRFQRTVPHGLPSGLLTPQGDGSGGYLAFLGRISPEKGPDAAIRIAREAGIPLKMAAKVDRADVEYFKEVVEPMLGDGVEFIGEINDAQKPAFLGGARALLTPIAWSEPFGLVMIEAMACGTPVIAFERGSVPEIIDHGTTGFVVRSEAEAVEAVRRLGTLDRKAVRDQFDARFTARRMAQDYLDLYEEIIAENQPVLQAA